METETKIKERERVYPESKMIQKIKYLTDRKVLQVMFNNGAIYAYGDVPEKVADSAFNAISIGSFVAKEIKGVYDFIKLSAW